MTIVGRTLLPAMGRADRAVQVGPSPVGSSPRSSGIRANCIRADGRSTRLCQPFAGPAIGQDITHQGCQAQGIVEFTVGEQTGLGRDA
jgi:hypothetical protein